MIKYKLSKMDKIKIFLNLYYTHPTIRYSRIIPGPVLIYFGMTNLNSRLYAMIVLGGLLYLFWPFVFIITLLFKYNDSEDSLIIKNDFIVFSSNDSSYEIPLKSVQRVDLTNNFLKISLKNSSIDKEMVFCVPLRKLVLGNPLKFKDKIESKMQYEMKYKD